MRGKVRQFDLAPQTRLAKVERLTPRFCHEVLQCDSEDCLITDESDLRDVAYVFGDRQDEVAAMLNRLERHYLIDGRLAKSTRIVELLEFLQLRGVAG
jgi:hypothetical protein